MWRKLRAVCCLERACKWHREGDAGTSRMEAELPAADGNVLSLIQTQQDKSEETSWCFI